MAPQTSFGHLTRLRAPYGIFEHALLDEPRPEHGMCVDDVARALVVTVREPSQSPALRGAATRYLDFLLAAVDEDGHLHNRRLLDGSWGDEATTDDHWGRAVWSFAVAAERSSDPVLSAAALEGARRAMRASTAWPRAIAYAAVGAGLLLDRLPVESRRILHEARDLLPGPRPDPAWPWPAEALTYANAVLPEAMIVIGDRLADPVMRSDGLGLLTWLAEEQNRDGHLSLVPVGGRRRGDAVPGYDQQPIEAACLAEASSTALLSTGDPYWSTVLDRCLRWFEGDNDAGVPVRDPATGAGFDGLGPSSVNQNRGAESTLAWLATAQLALAGVPA